MRKIVNPCICEVYGGSARAFCKIEFEKVESLMRAIENTYLDLPVEPDGEELLNDGVFAFYALWDAIRKVGEDLSRMSGDARIVDVIEAARKTNVTE